MRRPPSYSDSFIVLGQDTKLEPLFTEPKPSKCDFIQHAVVFIFKGSLHVLFISVFETTFYFLYVNHSEDAGILNTINTYYQPILHDCRTEWGNTTRWLLSEILAYELNRTSIDAAGANAFNSRTSYNEGLLILASMYSVISATICISILGIVRYKRWIVPWTYIFVENILFITVLAAYEYFFFRTIIYKYTTMSTPELNKYIVDGLETCLLP